MDKRHLLELLEAVQRNELSTADALHRLQTLPFADSAAARIDHHRALRRGFPEVIYGQFKTPEQVASIFEQLVAKHDIVLCTRATQEHAQATKAIAPQSTYDGLSQCLYQAPEAIPNRGRGKILVLCAGTTDLPVAKEAVLTAQLMGNHVELQADVGVAGLHRILAEIPRLREAEVVIVVAGMEGALPSVVGGLTDRPVIAVPTSIGYGVSQGGWAALVGMLSACTSGITVVNINNGFGAGYAASLINRRRSETNPLPNTISIHS